MKNVPTIGTLFIDLFLSLGGISNRLQKFCRQIIKLLLIVLNAVCIITGKKGR